MPVELTIRAMDGPCSGRLSSFGFSGTITHGAFASLGVCWRDGMEANWGS